MPLFTSVSRPITARIIAPALFLGTLLFFGGCEDKHIGRPCDIGVTPPDGEKVVAVNPAALECPSRICILPARDFSTNTGPLCTAECSSDDDCSGETGKGSGDTLCDTGFVCRRIIPKLENNPVSCLPVCVCKDFLLAEDRTSNLPPPSCQ